MDADTLEALSKSIEKLYADALFGNDDTSALGPMSEQHFLLCLDTLRQAQRQALIACYHLRRGD